MKMMGGGVKKGSCWWDDKASPWTPLMGGGGGLWPSSVPLLLCWWDETTAICFPSRPYLPSSHPLTPSPWMQTLCCPFKQHARVVFHLLLEVTRYEGTTIKHRPTRGKKKKTFKQLSRTEATFTAQPQKIIHKRGVHSLNICTVKCHQNQKACLISLTCQACQAFL